VSGDIRDTAPERLNACDPALQHPALVPQPIMRKNIHHYVKESLEKSKNAEFGSEQTV
jgi:hypothetical protein